MRAQRYAKVILAVFLWIVVLLIIYARSPLPAWLSVRSFVRQVRNNMDSVELQRWATNLLAQHAGDFGFLDSNDTNLPTGLKKVTGFDPNVEVFPQGAFSLAEEQPEVRLFCGSKDGPFLVVGFPTLATPSNQNIIPWKPGIYFVHDADLERWR